MFTDFWFSLSAVSFLLVFTCSLGMRGAYLLSLELLHLYFWGILVFIAPFILGTVVCFDFVNIISVWILHFWDDTSFDPVRFQE